MLFRSILVDEDHLRPIIARTGRLLGTRLESTDFEGDWPRLRGALFDLLDALAHAHARGLVHRDLKPDNTLWSLDGRQVKLTDFGVAHATESLPRLKAAHDLGRKRATLEWELAGEVDVAGTPNYMAPELVKAQVHAQGPWSDLYSLGCLAYRLITGAVPFPRAKPVHTLMAQVTDEPPPLGRYPGVPAGVGDWVSRLMAKRPQDRFQKAADAAAALRYLDDGATLTGVIPEAVAALANQWRPEHMETTLVDPVPLPDLTGEESRSFVGPPAYKWRTPIPHDWRSIIPEAETTPETMGIGLYALRRVPFVGRLTHRDRLWSALRQTVEDHWAQVIVLHGDSGTGKTRLVEWLGERADELGVAEVMRAHHEEQGRPGDGLRGMLVRAFRCADVPADALETHLGEVSGGFGEFDTDASRVLAQLISPPGELRDTPGVLFDNLDALFAALARQLERMADARPVIVSLDDAHFGRRSLEFARYLLERQAEVPTPILILATVRDDVLAERPETVQVLDRLVTAGAETLAIGAFEGEELGEFMGALLGFDAAVAHQVGTRSGGNAQFAIQLVEDWVQRGLLTPSLHGYRLRHDADVAVPATLRDVWAERIERALAESSVDEVRALELAATLGLEVFVPEWTTACAAAGVPYPVGLVDRLLDSALARCGVEGPSQRWRFAHGMLREALLGRARSAQRLEGHHRVCAAILVSEPEENHYERVARHLLGADASDAAIPHLFQAVERRIDDGDYGGAAELYQALDGALETRPETDDRKGHGWLLGSRLMRLRGQLNDADYLSDRARDAVVVQGWDHLQAMVMLERGRISKDRGEYSAAEPLMRAASELAGSNLSLVAHCFEELGVVLFRRGDGEGAKEALESGRAAFDAAEDVFGVGRCEYALARAALANGEHADARSALTHARGALASAGARAAMAACDNLTGDLRLAEGDLMGAERAYRDALRVWESLGAGNAAYARLNLGLTLAEVRRYDEARPFLNEALLRFDRQRMFPLAALARACLMAAAAAEAAWLEFDEQVARIQGGLRQGQRLDEQAAGLFERAASEASVAGDVDREVVAQGLADRIRYHLAQPNDADE